MVRVLIDNPEQAQYLEQFESKRETPQPWSVFIKVDAGGKYVPKYSLYRCLPHMSTFTGVRVLNQHPLTLKHC